MICENEYIHIIDLADAQNNILSNLPLKDEIDVVKGLFAVAYIPIDGAKNLNGFREEGQFKSGLISVKFSQCETTFTVPLFFQCVQGFASNEETSFNFNKQLLFRPIPIYKKVEPNTFLKVKYRDSLSAYRFKHNIKLFITYTDK